MSTEEDSATGAPLEDLQRRLLEAQIHLIEDKLKTNELRRKKYDAIVTHTKKVDEDDLEEREKRFFQSLAIALFFALSVAWLSFFYLRPIVLSDKPILEQFSFLFNSFNISANDRNIEEEIPEEVPQGEPKVRDERAPPEPPSEEMLGWKTFLQSTYDNSKRYVSKLTSKVSEVTSKVSLSSALDKAKTWAASSSALLSDIALFLAFLLSIRLLKIPIFVIAVVAVFLLGQRYLASFLFMLFVYMVSVFALFLLLRTDLTSSQFRIFSQRKSDGVYFVVLLFGFVVGYICPLVM